jgi:GxxExxY protein
VRLLAPTEEGIVNCPRCRCQWVWRRDQGRTLTPAEEATLVLCQACGQWPHVQPPPPAHARLCPLCRQPWDGRSAAASRPTRTPAPNGRAEQFAAGLQRKIATAAGKIHWRLGGGCARDICLDALARDLRGQGLGVTTDREFLLHYDDVEVRHCLDLLVEELIVVELVSADEALDNAAYLGRLRWCLQLAGKAHGLLVRFASDKLTVLPLSVPALAAGAG